MTRTRRLIASLLAAGMLTAAGATATSASHGSDRITVTVGRFQTLPGGADLDYDIDGLAVMLRRPARDLTRVWVHVRGLEPNTTYASHVHNAPCSATPPGGGHYQHEVGGAVDPVNEIWPTIRTNAAGIGNGAAIHGHVARADAQAIVIHWPDNSAVRLACLDLR